MQNTNKDINNTKTKYKPTVNKAIACSMLNTQMDTNELVLS